MKPLYILWHLGMGDALLCNGLVRVLAARHGAVQVPAYPHNMEAVKFMFSDDPNIEVVEAQNSPHAAAMAVASQNSIQLGFYAPEGDFKAAIFDEEFYRQAKVHFSNRWDAFKLPDLGTINSLVDEAACGEFSFIHHDPKRGFPIKIEYCKYPNYMAEPDRPYFHHLPLMKAAREVHCINSSFLILWDSMPHVEGQKLYFHRYPRNTDHPKLKKDWHIITK